MKLPLLDTAAALVVLPAAKVETLAGSIATWALASKLAVDLVARERVVPTVTRRAGRIEARWAAALAGSEDAASVAELASGSSCPRSTAIRSSCAFCCSLPMIRACSCPRPRCGRPGGAGSKRWGGLSGIHKSRCSKRSAARPGSSPPIASALEQARPERIELDPATAWVFLGEGAAALAEAGTTARTERARRRSFRASRARS